MPASAARPWARSPLLSWAWLPSARSALALPSWLLLAAVTASVTTAAPTAGLGGFAGMLGGAASAAVMITAVLLAVRSIAGVALPRDGHRALGLALRAHTLRVGVSRHSDPDAAGRPRPRAPSAFPLAV